MASAAFNASPIEGVVGRLFDKPAWFKGPKPGGVSKHSGSAGSRAVLSKAQQLARAAMRRPSAVAKLIRGGGTSDRKGLKGQLEYVFTKADAVLDSRGAYGEQTTLSNTDMNRITRTWDESWKSRTQAGNTSHVLLSYPIGTPLLKVTAITDAVCTEMLSSGDRTFDYVAGIHTDRDHPHAHIIINRFPNEGGPLFTFRRGTDVSYEAFKEAMVAHGERYGVEMQSTSRFERGLVERAPTTKDIYQARSEDREPEPRAHGEAYERYAKAAVNDAADLYSVLAVIADNQGFQPVVEACDLASEALRAGFSITTGDDDMQFAPTDVEALDQALSKLGDNLGQLRNAIATADPELRPSYDKEYATILCVASMHAPDTADAQKFRAEANDATPYGSFLNYDRAALEDPDLPGMIAKSVEGSGIDPGEVLARACIGADSHYLEAQWVIRDLQSIARAHGLDLNTEYAEVAHKLQDIYGELREDFIEIGALAADHEVYNTFARDAAVEHERAPPEQQAVSPEITELLQQHRDGYYALSSDLRRSGTLALQGALSQSEYQRVLDGQVEVLERFTHAQAEQTFLAIAVIEYEIDTNERRDLAQTFIKLQKEHKHEVKGHENDLGW